VALPARGPRLLCIAGLVAMAVGCLDPLEGSLLILPGTGLVALGTLLGRSPSRRTAAWAFALTAAGVAALFLLSARGGVGGDTGRPAAWLLLALPYPIGAILAFASGVRSLRGQPRR
jgi:hypothetical protein